MIPTAILKFFNSDSRVEMANCAFTTKVEEMHPKKSVSYCVLFGYWRQIIQLITSSRFKSQTKPALPRWGKNARNYSPLMRSKRNVHRSSQLDDTNCFKFPSLNSRHLVRFIWIDAHCDSVYTPAPWNVLVPTTLKLALIQRTGLLLR